MKPNMPNQANSKLNWPGVICHCSLKYGAENEYAVDPVGVDMTTPSQPKEDSGRPIASRDEQHAAEALVALAFVASEIKQQVCIIHGRVSLVIIRTLILISLIF